MQKSDSENNASIERIMGREGLDDVNENGEELVRGA